MFNVNSMETNAPRDVCEAVSVAQTGVMAFKMPVPMPLKTRAGDVRQLTWFGWEVEVGKTHTTKHPVRVLCRAL